MNEEQKYFDGTFCSIPPIFFKKELGSVTGKKVKVAVIDSGWKCSCIDSRIHHGIGMVSRKDELELALSEDFNDRIGHGTAITDLILQIAPDVSIFPVRVFGDRLETSIDILVEAVKWSIRNDINIINLSLGTLIKDALIPLYKICEIARRKGIVIVSSNSNSDNWSYPAIFENSIGVTSAYFSNPFYYIFNNNEAIECIAKGQNQFALWLDNERRYLSGNSYATPNITGIISLFIEKFPNISLEKIRHLLLSFSNNQH